MRQINLIISHVTTELPKDKSLSCIVMSAVIPVILRFADEIMQTSSQSIKIHCRPGMSRPGQPSAAYPGTGPFDAKRGPGRPAGRCISWPQHHHHIFLAETAIIVVILSACDVALRLIPKPWSALKWECIQSFSMPSFYTSPSAPEHQVWGMCLCHRTCLHLTSARERLYVSGVMRLIC